MTRGLFLLKEVPKVVFGLIPRFRRSLHEPAFQVGFLPGREHLLDLVGTSLQRLKNFSFVYLLESQNYFILL